MWGISVCGGVDPKFIAAYCYRYKPGGGGGVTNSDVLTFPISPAIPAVGGAGGGGAGGGAGAGADAGADAGAGVNLPLLQLVLDDLVLKKHKHKHDANDTGTKAKKKHQHNAIRLV